MLVRHRLVRVRWVMRRLKIQPALGLASEIALKSQRRIRRYATSTIDDLAQTRIRNVQGLDHDEVHRKTARQTRHLHRGAQW